MFLLSWVRRAVLIRIVLRELAEKLGARAFLVDGADELEEQWFQTAARVGVTAGASAPEVLVQGVLDRLRGWGGTVAKEVEGRQERVTFSLPKGLQV